MKIAAIVVTCNRLALLKENVAALRSQTRSPDEIIVVNNASGDGTEEWLQSQSGLTIVRQENLGSSGGQLAGIKTAFGRGHDWFWCMDDDTIPENIALEKLLNCPQALAEQTGFLCSVVRWTDGSIHLMNAPNVQMGYPALMDGLGQGVLPVVSASFVSVLIHRRAVAAKGLPLREMFLWYDDAEYTRRISGGFQCYQVLESIVEHKTKSNYWADFSRMSALPIFNLRYGLRNFVFLRRWEAPSRMKGWYRCARSALRLQLRVWQQFSGADRRALSRAVWSGVFFKARIERP